MYDFLSMFVMLLSGIYELFRITAAAGTIAELDKQLSNAGLSADVIAQLQSSRTSAMIDCIICAALLLLTVICLFRGIKYLIINNIILFTSTRTSDILKTTNSGK